MSKRQQSWALQVATGAGANGYDISDLTSVTVSIAGTFVGTYEVMVSYDKGTSWVQTGSNVTAAGVVSIPDAATAVRVDCSAYTSGTPQAAFSGVRTSGEGR